MFYLIVCVSVGLPVVPPALPLKHCVFISVAAGCLASTKKWSASSTTCCPAMTPTLATLTPRSRPEWPCCTCPSSASSWKRFRSSMTSLVKVKISQSFYPFPSLQSVSIYCQRTSPKTKNNFIPLSFLPFSSVHSTLFIKHFETDGAKQMYWA